MKVQAIYLSSMRNDEHFQFHTEVLELLNRTGAAKLKVEALFEAYLQHYRRADEALKKINKSAFTEQLQQADKRRDEAFRGLLDTHRVALKHFRPQVREAAKKLTILFSTYGNLARKPLNEQTSGLYNLMQELTGAYEADIKAAELSDWVEELETASNEFIALYRERLEEAFQKPKAVLPQERKNMDAAYRGLVERLNAHAIVEEAQLFRDCVERLNTLIAKYKLIMAQRAGRAKAKRATASSLPPVEEEAAPTE